MRMAPARAVASATRRPPCWPSGRRTTRALRRPSWPVRSWRAGRGGRRRAVDRRGRGRRRAVDGRPTTGHPRATGDRDARRRPRPAGSRLRWPARIDGRVDRSDADPGSRGGRQRRIGRHAASPSAAPSGDAIASHDPSSVPTSTDRATPDSTTTTDGATPEPPAATATPAGRSGPTPPPTATPAPTPAPTPRADAQADAHTRPDAELQGGPESRRIDRHRGAHRLDRGRVHGRAPAGEGPQLVVSSRRRIRRRARVSRRRAA